MNLLRNQTQTKPKQQKPPNKPSFFFDWERKDTLGMGMERVCLTSSWLPLPTLPCCARALFLQVFPEAVDPGDVVAQLECKSLTFNYFLQSSLEVSSYDI